MDEMKNLLREIDELSEEIKEKELLKWKEKIKEEMRVGRMAIERVFRHFYGERTSLNNIDMGSYFFSDEVKSIKEKPQKEKEWIVQLIEKEMEKWTEDMIEKYLFSAFKKDVKNKEDRLKLITKGYDMSEIVLIEEKEKKEIIDIYYKLAILSLKKDIDYKEKDLELSFFKCLSKLQDSIFVREFSFLALIKESRLKEMYSLEEVEKIKAYLQIWYQGKAEKPILIDYKKTVTEAKEYLYLLNEKEKKEVVEEFKKTFLATFKMINITKDFGYASPLQELNKLKEQIKEIETFT